MGVGKPSDADQESFVYRENAVTLKPAKVEASTQVGYLHSNGFLQTDRALIASTSLRVGLLDWLEIGATLPAFTGSRSRVVRPFVSRSEAVSGLGDLVIQANMRLHEQTAGTPGVVASVGGILPTGVSPYRFAFYQPLQNRPAYNPNPTDLNGNYLSRGAAGLTGNVEVYKILDPIIVFFGAGTQYFFSREIEAHRVQPGPAYTYNLGLSFALSEKSTLGFQINGFYESQLLVDSHRVPESEFEPIVARVTLIQRVFPQTWIEPELDAGLTSSAPNLGLALGLRHRF